MHSKKKEGQTPKVLHAKNTYETYHWTKQCYITHVVVT